MLSIYFPLQHFRKPSLYAVLARGNLTSDQDAGLTGMTYNALNLLSGYTHSADGYDTRITYTASGEKTDVFTEDNQIVASHWHRFGNLIYDGSFSSNRLLVDGGYVDVTNAGYSYRFYIQDHQGNNRMVTDANGTVLQVNHYDPYGQLLSPISSTSAVSEYKYGGKEWSDVTLSYDFGARNYLPSIPRWSTMDPLAEKYYSLSPYVYCAGNPVNLVDPDGRSTRVKKLPDGTFEVIGGSIDDEDLNVFVYSPDENGEYTIKGESIGITTSITSFYHAEIDTWKGVIDINDVSGMVFLDRIVDENQSLLGFALDARKEQLNDFKNTNGTVDISDDKRDMYRGMPVGITSKGRLVFSSARDIGNMAAGYKSGLSGLGWIITRMAFDGYQSYQSSEISFESISSVNAQFYGWKRGFGEYLKRKKTFKR